MEQRFLETGSVTPAAHVNAGRPWAVRTPNSEDSIVAAVERELQGRYLPRELELISPWVREMHHHDLSHPNHYSRRTHLFSDVRPLRMQFCEWLRREQPADEPV
jgi:hypothetical protein